VSAGYHAVLHVLTPDTLQNLVRPVRTLRSLPELGARGILPWPGQPTVEKGKGTPRPSFPSFGAHDRVLIGWLFVAERSAETPQAPRRRMSRISR
jgi:hypothetical protein